MFLSALDPALLIYELEDWVGNEAHCLSRLDALRMHRKMLREHEQPIVTTDDLDAILYGTFPLNPQYKNIAELYDVRRFIFEDLQRAHRVSPQLEKLVTLQPEGITCTHLVTPTVDKVWEALLLGCVAEAIQTSDTVQIITWKEDASGQLPETMTLTVTGESETATYLLPVVWDADSWLTQLAPLDAWPDFQRCVELCFLADPGMRSFERVRERPLPFEWTDRFEKSVGALCQPPLRTALLKALTKTVYGISDTGLHDEPYGDVRRIRVTRAWRIHYQDFGDKIVFDEFGPHDL